MAEILLTGNTDVATATRPPPLQPKLLVLDLIARRTSGKTDGLSARKESALALVAAYAIEPPSLRSSLPRTGHSEITLADLGSMISSMARFRCSCYGS